MNTSFSGKPDGMLSRPKKESHEKAEEKRRVEEGKGRRAGKPSVVYRVGELVELIGFVTNLVCFW